MEVITQVLPEDNPEKSIDLLADHVRRILFEEYDLSAPEECNGFLIRCLRVKDYDVEKAAKLVKNVARAMESLRELIDKYFHPKLYKEGYLNGQVTVLRSRDDKGRQVIVSRVGKWDTKIHEFDEVTSASMLLFGYTIAQSSETQRKGVVFVYDLTDFGVRHVKAMKPGRLTQLVRMMQDGAPGKIKGIHLVFHPRVFGVIYQLVKPFLKEKITKRVYFHGDDLSSLHKHVRQDILPSYLGGFAENPSQFMDVQLIKKLIHDETIHKEIMTYGIPAT